jgi:hypothetical protein
MADQLQKIESAANYSRRPLSEEKIRKFKSMLMMGCSRRMAAFCVGCSPSTITRYIERDPEFRQQVVEAEQILAMKSLRSLRAAGENPRYWRANAWLLERLYPGEYGKRPTLGLTTDHIRRMLASFIAGAEEAVPEGKWDIVLDKFDEYCDNLEKEQHSIQLPPLPTAKLPPPYEPPRSAAHNAKWDIAMRKVNEYFDMLDKEEYGDQLPPFPTDDMPTSPNCRESASPPNLPVGHPSNEGEDFRNPPEDLNDCY